MRLIFGFWALISLFSLSSCEQPSNVTLSGPGAVCTSAETMAALKKLLFVSPAQDMGPIYVAQAEAAKLNLRRARLDAITSGFTQCSGWLYYENGKAGMFPIKPRSPVVFRITPPVGNAKTKYEIVQPMPAFFLKFFIDEGRRGRQ